MPKNAQRHSLLSLLFLIATLFGCSSYPVYVQPVKATSIASELRLPKPIAQFSPARLTTAFAAAGFQLDPRASTSNTLVLRFSNLPPENYFDCGRELRFNSQGQSTFDALVASRQLALEEITPNTVYYAISKLHLQGEAQITLTPDGAATMAKPYVTYQLSRDIAVFDRGMRLDGDNSQLTLSTTQPRASFPGLPGLRAYTCQSKGTMEQELLNVLNTAG